jgi:aminopeptidase N
MNQKPARPLILACFFGALASVPTWAEPAAKFAVDRPLDVQHVKLDMRVDLKKKTVASQAVIDATALRPVRTIRLDAVDFQVDKVEVSDPASEQWTTCKYENDGKHLTLKLPEPLAAGARIRIHIDYRLSDPQSGLFFFAPSDEEPDVPYVLWTQGESITNRYWVPCLDHPNEKQTTEVVCSVEKPYIAISNGRLLDQKENPDGTRTFHWLQDKPHVSYLMTLVVGDFFTKTVQWRGKPVSFHVREKFKDQIDNSFANTTRMLDFFSDKIGVEYPWDKYDQVCCYSFGGGMENTSATTLTEMTLHDDRAHVDDDSDGLVAHELAHQWWGDLLTCKDWAHIWLNEGFASYFEALWDEHNLGPDEFAYNMFEKARGAMEGGKDKPIVYHRYEDPDQQFDSRAYPKGAWVLHMIRRRLGDELFWKSINAYANRFKYQCVDTTDLRKVIEDVTGQGFERFFHDWTERSGHPTVKIEYEWIEEDGLAKVSLTQTQDQEAFALPLTLAFHGEQGALLKRLTREISKKEETFYIPLAERPSLVQVDPDNAVLMDLTLELPRDSWEAMLKSDPNPVGRIRAARHFGASKSKQDQKLLAERLAADPFWAVQRAIARELGEAGGDVAREALLAGLSIKNPKVRAAVAESLGKFEEESEVEQALAEIVKKGDPSYRVEANAIEAWADVYQGDPTETLKGLMSRDSDNEVIRRAVLRSIGKHGGAGALDLLIEWTAPAHPQPCRSGAVEGMGDLIEREELATEDEKRGIEAMGKCLKKGSRRLQMAALSALEKLGPKGKPALEEIERLAKIGGPRSKSMAMRAAKKIREQAPESEKLGELRERLSKLEKENRELRERITKVEANKGNEEPDQETDAK